MSRHSRGLRGWMKTSSSQHHYKKVMCHSATISEREEGFSAIEDSPLRPESSPLRLESFKSETPIDLSTAASPRSMSEASDRGQMLEVAVDVRKPLDVCRRRWETISAAPRAVSEMVLQLGQIETNLDRAAMKALKTLMCGLGGDRRSSALACCSTAPDTPHVVPYDDLIDGADGLAAAPEEDRTMTDGGIGCCSGATESLLLVMREEHAALANSLSGVRKTLNAMSSAVTARKREYEDRSRELAREWASTETSFMKHHQRYFAARAEVSPAARALRLAEEMLQQGRVDVDIGPLPRAQQRADASFNNFVKAELEYKSALDDIASLRGTLQEELISIVFSEEQWLASEVLQPLMNHISNTIRSFVGAYDSLASRFARLAAGLTAGMSSIGSPRSSAESTTSEVMDFPKTLAEADSTLNETTALRQRYKCIYEVYRQLAIGYEKVVDQPVPTLQPMAQSPTNKQITAVVNAVFTGQHLARKSFRHQTIMENLLKPWEETLKDQSVSIRQLETVRDEVSEMVHRAPEEKRGQLEDYFRKNSSTTEKLPRELFEEFLLNTKDQTVVAATTRLAQRVQQFSQQDARRRTTLVNTCIQFTSTCHEIFHSASIKFSLVLEEILKISLPNLLRETQDSLQPEYPFSIASLRAVLEEQDETLHISNKISIKFVGVRASIDPIPEDTEQIASERLRRRTIARCIEWYLDKHTGFCINPGDSVQVLVQTGDTWLGMDSTGRTGYFPASAVQADSKKQRGLQSSSTVVSTAVEAGDNVLLNEVEKSRRNGKTTSSSEEASSPAPQSTDSIARKTSFSERSMSYPLAPGVLYQDIHQRLVVKKLDWMLLPPSGSCTVSHEFTEKFSMEGEVLATFACAIKHRILLQGRMYVTSEHVAFWSQFNGLTVFGQFPTIVVFPFKSVVEVRPSLSALIFPTAIDFVLTDGSVHHFASFLKRNDTVEFLNTLHELVKTTDTLSGDDTTRSIVNVPFSSTPRQPLPFLISDFTPARNGELVPTSLLKYSMPVALWRTSLDAVLQIFITDISEQSVSHRILEANGAFDFTLTPLEEPEDKSYWPEREMKYQLRVQRTPLTNLLNIRDACQVVEKSTLYCVSRDLVFLEVEVNTSGVPLSDYFTCKTRYVLHGLPEGCQMDAQFQLIWHKSTLFAGKIESECYANFKESVKNTYTFVTEVLDPGGFVVPLDVNDLSPHMQCDEQNEVNSFVFELFTSLQSPDMLKRVVQALSVIFLAVLSLYLWKSGFQVFVVSRYLVTVLTRPLGFLWGRLDMTEVLLRLEELESRIRDLEQRLGFAGDA